MAFIALKHEGANIMRYWGCIAFIAPRMTLVCFTHDLRLRCSKCHTFVRVYPFCLHVVKLHVLYMYIYIYMYAVVLSDIS